MPDVWPVETRHARPMTPTITSTAVTAIATRRPGLRAAQAAAVVGSAYAAVSIAWGLGSTVLLDTVGGELAAGGLAGRRVVLAALWMAVMLKVAAVVLPLLLVAHTTRPAQARIVRALTWIETTVLIGYGLVLTTVGLLVQADVVHAAAGADHRALAWHAYLWDPWFLVWGLLVSAAVSGARSSRTLRS